jgi:putative ABC transport system permease protein
MGLLVSLALTRVIAAMLVGVEASDPVTFAAMAVLFLMVAAVASWIPAARAAALDANAALREE